MEAGGSRQKMRQEEIIMEESELRRSKGGWGNSLKNDDGSGLSKEEARKVG